MELINFKKPQILLTRLPTPVPTGEAEVGGRKPNDGDEVEKSMGDRPMVVEAGTSSRPEELEMDSESSLSVSSVRSRRLWRRHSQSIDNCSLRSSDTDEPPPKAPTTDGRGRGRSTPTPTTGKYVGIKKAQQERDRLKREEARKRAEEELEERLRYVKSPLPPKTDTDDDLPVLKEDLIQCGQIVRATVRKSGNLKGTSQKALNRVINIITRYVQQPESAAITRLEEERKKWRENSARLEESVKRLEEENSSLRRRLEDLEASNNSRTTTEEMLAMVEARVQARLESALMGPAQRPSLAHERKAASGDTQLPVSGGIVGGAPAPKSKREKGKGTGKRTAQPAPPHPAAVAEGTSAPPQPIAGPSTAPDTTPAPRAARQRKGQTKKTAPAPKEGGKKKGPVQASPEPRPLPPAPTSMETPWVVVASRKSKKTKPAVPPKKVQAQQQARRTEPKVRPPRSAAVIISLTPAAVAKGLSYKQVLTDAQTRVDLTGLDISRLKPKRLWRRHSRSIDSWSLNLTSDTDEPVPKAQTTDGRGRGRPPSVGKYVGLRQAQRERDRLKREEARQKPESEVVARLECEVKKSLEHSARLEASMKLIQEENTALRRRLEELEASASKTSAEEMWAMEEGGDGAREKAALNPKPSKGKRKKPALQAPAPEPRPLPPAPASMETPWVEVVGRNKKKRKPAAAVNTQPRQPARRAEPKLRPPRSAAVVITSVSCGGSKGPIL
ncbi:MAP7 domain-containing protein 1-like [Manduca sexta]|uniref:MAP7 domain-containing protein 1-like n=1 Tax=Manduca sexta TaxID=7130 RepID=UPI001890B215|nr:MAP7 domain-containing protein 1-like [Manduca sexta]